MRQVRFLITATLFAFHVLVRAEQPTEFVAWASARTADMPGVSAEYVPGSRGGWAYVQFAFDPASGAWYQAQSHACVGQDARGLCYNIADPGYRQAPFYRDCWGEGSSGTLDKFFGGALLADLAARTHDLVDAGMDENSVWTVRVRWLGGARAGAPPQVAAGLVPETATLQFDRHGRLTSHIVGQGRGRFDYQYVYDEDSPTHPAAAPIRVISSVGDPPLRSTMELTAVSYHARGGPASFASPDSAIAAGVRAKQINAGAKAQGSGNAEFSMLDFTLAQAGQPPRSHLVPTFEPHESREHVLRAAGQSVRPVGTPQPTNAGPVNWALVITGGVCSLVAAAAIAIRRKWHA